MTYTLMKTLKNWILMLGFLASSSVFNSCLDDNDEWAEFWEDRVQAIVTVKPMSDNSYYLQLDDSTTLFPTNNSLPEVPDETRAYVIYEVEDSTLATYDKAINLIRLDTLLTKEIAPDLGDKNDSYYGTDMLALNGSSIWSKNGVWIEDGYITFDFFLLRGHNNNVKHFINLVQANSDDPYELEFRHNAYGDVDSNVPPVSGLVSFKLDKLPSTNGQTVKLKIKYKSFAINDYRTIELDYRSYDDQE